MGKKGAKRDQDQLTPLFLMQKKLEEILHRFNEIEQLIEQKPELSGTLMRERGKLLKVVSRYNELVQVKKQIEETTELLNDKSEEIKKMAADELLQLKEKEKKLITSLEEQLSEEAQKFDSAVIMEIRPGTGGEEAALFAADLFRMYTKFIEKMKLGMEIIDVDHTDLKGLKHAIVSVEGDSSYKLLRFESGTHRVQRVPHTEASGRIHTSAATVAVLPQVEDVDINIKKEDMNIETIKGRGAGGQYVNKTESSIRITHLPTNIVVVSCTERSQHRNRDLAMKLLRARLFEYEETKRNSQRSHLRKTQIGSGDRSEKVRTYNFPQNRVTDHRIEFTTHRLEEIMNGDLTEIINKLEEADRKKRLEIANIK